MRKRHDICRAVYEVGKIIKYLRLHSDDTIIIVEGRRDRDALGEIGFGYEPILVYNHTNFEDNVMKYRERGYKLVLILVDFDREGVKIHRKLRNLLSGYGFTELSGFRDVLSRYTVFFGYSVESFFRNYNIFRRVCMERGLIS